ncbi:MAG: class I SAM-dependent methyltransferase [Oscillospiraceae bacterium]
MRVCENWQDYELIATSDGEKLERWGEVLLIRPDPQVLWSVPKIHKWADANAHYHRSKEGGGEWDNTSLKKSNWTIKYKDLSFNIRPTGFKHTGLFPEQAVNWDFMEEKIKNSHRPVKILNLFAYTGGATLACLKAGAAVVHVDASKGMVQWARDNAKLSGLESAPCRWIVDDCQKFIDREIRRGNKYDGIIMDPPSYGRGPNGEIWKLEDNIFALLKEAARLLSDNPLFFLLNSYTTGLSPSVMQYLLAEAFNREGLVISSEIGLKVTESGLILPQGSTAIWQK